MGKIDIKKELKHLYLPSAKEVVQVDVPTSVIKVVIIGGGFGGLYAAKAFRGKSVQITLIDRRNFHLFQPLLYQVATGGLSPADIAFPLRAIFKKQNNVQVVLGDVSGIDLIEKKVRSSDKVYPYDYLILAAGSGHHYFGHNEWAEKAPGLKTLEEATSIRGRILSSFELAEIESDPEKRKALLSFVIVGGGPAGVELAGAIAELSRYTLLHDFRSINPEDARILLVEGANRILPPYPQILSEKAKESLLRLGVEIMISSSVTDISANEVTVKSGENFIHIPTETVLWAAGVKASYLGQQLEEKYDIPCDRGGRLFVEPDCSLPGFDHVFVVGDLAHYKNEKDNPLPGVAPVAIQQGRYVADTIMKKISGQNINAFSYNDRGSLAVIGRLSAVAFRGKYNFSGYFAWLLWLFVHLLYLVGFENRLLVMLQWAFNYFTRNQSARLITNTK